MASGQLLREARLRAGLTQAALAERAGTLQSAVARWERGEVAPSFETLRRLVRACGLELSVSLATFDDSYAGEIRDRLARPPAQRVELALELAHEAQRIRRGSVILDG